MIISAGEAPTLPALLPPPPVSKSTATTYPLEITPHEVQNNEMIRFNMKHECCEMCLFASLGSSLTKAGR